MLQHPGAIVAVGGGSYGSGEPQNALQWGSVLGKIPTIWGITGAASREASFRQPELSRGGKTPPKVNLTLSWWNTAVISLPVTVRWLCQAALTMAVN